MDLILEHKGHISPDLCKRLISKYTKDQTFSRFLEWDDEYRELLSTIKLQLHEYTRFSGAKMPQQYGFDDCEVPSFTILKDADTKGIQHNESIVEDQEAKFTFLWYLDDEGETDFFYRKVKAETGKLVIFPATWTQIYVHSPSYIVMGNAVKYYKEMVRR
jgi:hypothetical protein